MPGRFRADRIRFGDDFGPITDRMHDECGNYVYVNESLDPHTAWGLDTLYVFLCKQCDVGVPWNGCRTQAQIDARAKLTEEIEAERFRKAQDDATRKVAEREKREEEQQFLFGDWD